MASLDFSASVQDAQPPPVVAKLQSIFAALPDDELLSQLRGVVRRGPKGHDTECLWYAFVAYYTLGLESVSALIRTLHDNPFIAKACGYASPSDIPSQPTFSRFFTKLAGRWIALAVKKILRALVVKCHETLSGFGKTVAIDSTTVKGWANGGKKGRIKTFNRIPGLRGPKPKFGKYADPEAGWSVKKATNGRDSYTFGYKVHILCDTTYELPLAITVTAGNVHDLKGATPLLSEARYTFPKFHPRHVLADAAYSSEALRHTIHRQYRAEPVIDPNPSHKKAVAKTDKTPAWKAIYSLRTAVERVNARLKGQYNLGHIRVRGKMKVMVHALMSAIVYQVQALEYKSLTA